MARKPYDPLAFIPSPEVLRDKLRETLTLADRLRLLLDLAERIKQPSILTDAPTFEAAGKAVERVA